MIAGIRRYSVFSRTIVPLMVALLVIVAGVRTSHAQEVTLQGTITAVSGSTVTVGNVVVDVSRVDRDDDDIYFAVGQNFQGSIVQINNIWVVQQIFSINNVIISGSTPSPTPVTTGTIISMETPTASPTATLTNTLSITPTATATSTPPATPAVTPSGDDDHDPIIVIEGPIQVVNANIITIYNINIVVNAPNANVNVAVGTMVRIEGIGCGDDDDDDCALGGSVNNIQVVALTIVNEEVTTGGNTPPNQPGSGGGSPGGSSDGGGGGDDDDDDDDD